MPLRIPSWLAVLALCAFTLQTDDFVIVGVLPELAHDLRVSEAAAGQLVTVFSVVCAVAAPVAAVVTAAWPRRRVLLGGFALFCAANLLAPLAPSYPALLGLRVVAALAAATTLPTVLAVAASLSPAERRGRDLATVMAGLTSAVVIGVPLGTWAGAAFGWQATFLLVGALGLSCLALVRAVLPASPPAAAPTFAERLRPLGRPAVLGVLTAAVVAVAGNFTIQTYLAPFLRDSARVDAATLGLLLALTGVAGVAGARLSGTLVDRWGAGRAFAAASAAFTLAMAGLAACWWLRPVPLAAVLPALLLWSAAAWSVPPAVQTRVLTLATPETGPQVLALTSSAVYVGASLGGALGGVLLTGGAGTLPLASAACALAALPVFAAARPGYGRRQSGKSTKCTS